MQDLLKKISVRELRLLMLGVGATIAALLITTLVIPNAKSMQTVRKEIQLLEATARDGRELELQLEQQHESIAELRYRLDGDMVNLADGQVGHIAIELITKLGDALVLLIELLLEFPAVAGRRFEEVKQLLLPAPSHPLRA